MSNDAHYRPVRFDLESVIYTALRSDYLRLPPLPKGTRNIECARDEVRARVIAEAIRRHFEPVRVVETGELALVRRDGEG